MKEIGVTMANVKSFAQMSAVLDVFVGSKTSTVEKEGTNWNGDLGVSDYNGACCVSDQLFFCFFHHRQIYWYRWQSIHYNAQMFHYGCPEINANGAGKGLNDYLNADYPFINVLKLDSREYKNEHYEKDAELTVRDVLTCGDFSHELCVHDSILYEIEPSHLDNEKNVQNGANDEDSADTVAEEDLTDIGDNDDETDLDLILNLFDDENENENETVFDQIAVSTQKNSSGNIARFTDKTFVTRLIGMIVCLVVGLSCNYFVRCRKNIQS